MLDYPGKLSCIFWFAGCNMRCRYCYNPEIVRGKGTMSVSDALKFLDQRKNLLDAVVLSGGECTLHSGMLGLLQEIKNRGFLIKIDTNGSDPRALDHILKSNLVDYIALDFKAMKKNFFLITQSDLFTKFEKSLDLLINSKVDFEVRTTVHSSLISSQDLSDMSAYLKHKGYRGIYYLQPFFNHTPTLENMEQDTLSICPDIQDFCSLPVVIR